MNVDVEIRRLTAKLTNCHKEEECKAAAKRLEELLQIKNILGGDGYGSG